MSKKYNNKDIRETTIKPEKNKNKQHRMTSALEISSKSIISRNKANAL